MNLKNNNITYQMIFGGVSGLVEHTLSFIPRNILDFIQINKKVNIYLIIKKAYITNNFTRFTNGYFPMISCVCFAHINLFYFYEKSKLEKENYMIFLNGVLGKIGHDIILCPGDTIRCHCNILNINCFNATKNIIKSGSLGFFNGLPSSLMMSTLGGGLEILFLSKFNKIIDNQEMSLMTYFPGFFAGFCTSVILSTIDMIKTQMQLRNTKVINKKIENHYLLLKDNYKNLGIKGLFRGSGLRGLQSGICFGTYETLNILFLKS